LYSNWIPTWSLLQRIISAKVIAGHTAALVALPILAQLSSHIPVRVKLLVTAALLIATARALDEIFRPRLLRPTVKDSKEAVTNALRLILPTDGKLTGPNVELLEAVASASGNYSQARDFRAPEHTSTTVLRRVNNWRFEPEMLQSIRGCVGEPLNICRPLVRFAITLLVIVAAGMVVYAWFGSVYRLWM
jgi:hypothetical protein